MQKKLYGICLAFALLSCKKNITPTAYTMMIENTLPDKGNITLRGIITAINNGKDGYTASVKNEQNVLFFATISKVNMQSSKSTYTRYAVGDEIQVQGEYWTDNEGFIHITVAELQAF